MTNMIISNFLKRTMTIIYILILIVAFLLIYIVTILDSNRVDFYNAQYQDAYIEFQSTYEDLDRIKDIANIDTNIVLGISTKINDTKELFWVDDSLQDGELIAARKVFPDKQIGDKVVFEYYIPYEFTIVSFTPKNNALSYISKDALIAIEKYYDSIYYQVILRDWTKLDNTILKINENYLIERSEVNVRGYYNTDDLTIYDIRYYIFRTILIALIILSIYFVVKELYKEDKENFYMYYCLGFTKKKLIFLGIIKLLLIITIAALIFGIIFTLLSF